MVNEVIEMQQKFEVQKILFPTEQKIKEVEEEFREFPTDMTVPENYDFVKAGIKKVKKYITATEKYRVSSQAEALKHCKATNKVAKFISGRFIAVNEPMVKVITEFETKKEIERREAERKEAERQENIEKRIDVITGLISTLMMADAGSIKTEIEKLSVDDLAWADEHLEAVAELRDKTIQQLNELYNMKVAAAEAKAAAEKAEQDRLRQEKEDQKKREAEQKAIMVENARLRAENEKNEAELKAAARKIKDQEAAAEEAERKAKAEKKEAEERERIRVKLEEEQKFQAVEALKRKEEQRKKEKAEAEERERIRVKQAKEEVEKQKTREADREEAVAFTIDQLVAHNSDGGDEMYLLQAIQANKFKHIKWVD